MEIVFSPEALADLDYWRHSGNKKIQKRITALIDSISNSPFSGIGKPEGLRNEWAGYWSRRITDEHRLIYKVEKKQIFIAQLRYHY